MTSFNRPGGQQESSGGRGEIWGRSLDVLRGRGKSLGVHFGVFALFSLRFFIDHETKAETNKVQQKQHILKYIDIQRYSNDAFRSHR